MGGARAKGDEGLAFLQRVILNGVAAAAQDLGPQGFGVTAQFAPFGFDFLQQLNESASADGGIGDVAEGGFHASVAAQNQIVGRLQSMSREAADEYGPFRVMLDEAVTRVAGAPQRAFGKFADVAGDEIFQFIGKLVLMVFAVPAQAAQEQLQIVAAALFSRGLLSPEEGRQAQANDQYDNPSGHIQPFGAREAGPCANEPGMLKSKVALICPCGPPHVGKTRQGIEILRSWGVEVEPGPILSRYLSGQQSAEPLSFLAASDAERREELAWALGPEVEACWVVRGGYGLTRLVANLPPLGQERPVLGFSDVSVLLHALQRRGWPRLFHCANVQTLPVLDSASLEATRRLVLGQPLRPLPGRWLLTGRAEGLLWGGNLCVLASLCGTPEAMTPEARILALEDINEAPYRLDRLLTQLQESGALRGLVGVALGGFTGCGDLTALWQAWSERWQVPVLADLPFGHGPDNHPLHLGERVVLDYSQISWVERSILSGSGAGPLSSSPAG